MEILNSLSTTMPEDLRLQAQIELRALRVLNFQRQLRIEVSENFLNSNFDLYNILTFSQMNYFRSLQQLVAILR